LIANYLLVLLNGLSQAKVMTRLEVVEVIRKAVDRAAFEDVVRGLVGLVITGVDYWDVYNFSEDASKWDYGSWHNAVMGVELATDEGPVTVIWRSFGYPCVDIFRESITNQFVFTGREDPCRIGPDGPSTWDSYLGQPIRAARAIWETMRIGPARHWDGTVAEPAYDMELPIAVRLDFDDGAVWFVAGLPEFDLSGEPILKDTFIPGDEIMVVFDQETLEAIGLDPLSL
jgi:hypothetical protein